MLKDFIKDFIKYIPSKVTPFILAFAFIPILTRLLTPTDYGIFTLILTFNLIISTLVTGWLYPSAIRFFAEYKISKNLNVFYSSFFFCLFTQVIIVSVLYLISAAIYELNFSNIKILIFISAIAAFVSMSLSYGIVELFRANREIKSYSIYLISSNFLQFILSIGLILIFNMGVKGILLGYFLGFGMVVPFMVYQIAKKNRISIQYVNKKTILSFATYGFPLVASNILWWVLNFSDRYLINFFIDKENVGIYSANYDLIDKSIRNIGIFFIFVASPIIMNVWETRGEQETVRILRDILKYIILFLLPITVFVAIDFREISEILLNINYCTGNIIIPVVSVAALFLSLQQFFQYSFILKKKRKEFYFSLLLQHYRILDLTCFLSRNGEYLGQQLPH